MLRTGFVVEVVPSTIVSFFWLIAEPAGWTNRGKRFGFKQFSSSW
jgi:hypothetical protein